VVWWITEGSYNFGGSMEKVKTQGFSGQTAARLYRASSRAWELRESYADLRKPTCRVGLARRFRVFLI